MLSLFRNGGSLILRQKTLRTLRSTALFLALASLLTPAFSAEAFSLKVPEVLTYDLTWAGIKAGEASLEIRQNADGATITSTARSAKWVSVFYTVEDTVQSVLQNFPQFPGIGRPVRYHLNIREGKNRKNKEVIFDHTTLRALYIDHLEKERKEIDIPQFIFDPLSSFYFLRTQPLQVGKSVYVTVFDSKKVWNVEVQVLRREKIEVPAGEFNAIVVKPLMQSEGIFYRKGEIYIWLTDDERRIPVMLKTKIKIGSVNALLTGGNY